MNKKDVLFYTFLTIFVVTAVITILGIVNIIPIRAGYLNTLVTVFVVQLAGAVIAMFRNVDFFENDHRSEAPNLSTESLSSSEMLRDYSVPQIKPEPQVDSALQVNSAPKVLELRADDYFAKIGELAGRFAEREQFALEVAGSKVQWSGFVSSVSTHSDKICVSLKTDEELRGDLMLLYLPEDCRTRAFALQEGDMIRFEGFLDTKMSVITPLVEAQSFVLEKHKGQKSSVETSAELR